MMNELKLEGTSIRKKRILRTNTRTFVKHWQYFISLNSNRERREAAGMSFLGSVAAITL
jgi:hypothetical protein